MELLTMAELAKRTNIPESTARYYKNKHEMYFPCEGSGRKKRYRVEAAEVLRIIAEGYNRNATATEINDLLSVQFTTFIDVHETTATTTATTQQQPYFEILTALSDSIKTIADQQGRMDRMEQEIQELRRLITDQQEQRQPLITGQDPENKPSFWARLLGKV